MEPDTGKNTGKDTARGMILPYGGHTPEIAEDVYIAPGAAVIGDVVIAAGSSVWFNTVVRGDFNEVRVGSRSNIQDGVVIHVASYGSGCPPGMCVAPMPAILPFSPTAGRAAPSCFR